MRYFDHDSDAWKDDKIAALCFDYGLAAYGLYFVVLELIYEDEGAVNLAATEPLTKSVARWFGIGSEEVEAMVREMVKVGLLVKKRTAKKGLLVTSNRAEDNIKRYQARCETARQNGKKGGRKPSGNQDANRVGSDELTKSGGKEKKRKEIVSDSHKDYPNTSRPAGAAADVSAPRCPKCGAETWKDSQTGSWNCPECFSVLRKDGTVA